MVDHPELFSFVSDTTIPSAKIGACLEWKYSFEKCIEANIPKLKEKSVDFLLENYYRNALCHTIISTNPNELIIYMFFQDEKGLSSCLSRPGLGYYEGELPGEYKEYMKSHKLHIFQLILGDSPNYFSIPSMQTILYIIYALITFSIFMYIESVKLKLLLLVLLTSSIKILENQLRKIRK